MLFTVLSIVVMYVGIGILIYGLVQTYSVQAQLASLIGSGFFSTGILWVIFGAILIIGGTVMLLVKEFGKPKKKY